MLHTSMNIISNMQYFLGLYQFVWHICKVWESIRSTSMGIEAAAVAAAAAVLAQTRSTSTCQRKRERWGRKWRSRWRKYVVVLYVEQPFSCISSWLHIVLYMYYYIVILSLLTLTFVFAGKDTSWCRDARSCE